LDIDRSSFPELLEEDEESLENSLERISNEYHQFLNNRESEYSVDLYPEFKEANTTWENGGIARVIRSTVLFDRKDAVYLEISAQKPLPSEVKTFETGLAVVDIQNISSNIGFAYETVNQFTEEDIGI
jgi:hypothetical protein